MISIGLGHYLTLGAIIFTIGIIGIFLNRKNIIVILMSILGFIFRKSVNFLIIGVITLALIVVMYQMNRKKNMEEGFG